MSDDVDARSTLSGSQYCMPYELVGVRRGVQTRPRARKEDIMKFHQSLNGIKHSQKGVLVPLYKPCLSLLKSPPYVEH